MIPISPEQSQALRNVLSRPEPKVATSVGCSEEVVRQFLETVRSFAQLAYTSLPDQTYVLAFQTGVATGNPITVGALRAQIKVGNRVFGVDGDLRLFNASSEATLLSAISERTATSGSFEVLINGTYLYYILAGRVIDEGPISSVTPSARPSSQWRRPFSDIEDLLRDHVENYIAREQGTRYWAEKNDRILLTGPDGTEYIFQNALHWWLRHYVSDSIDVYAEPSRHGQDKTDLVVITLDGKFVIEVKWLGKNQKNTTYSESRIQEGLEQVAIYLINDSRIIWGYLVIYDARPFDEHSSGRSYDPTCRHQRCAEPTLIFLESDTPTQTVKRRRRRKRVS